MKNCMLFFIYFLPFVLAAEAYPASVVRVVDGDTVILYFNNQEERVRIIGIDTPEVVAPGRPVECFGKEASQYAHKLLPAGSTVSFEFTNTYDVYDRALGYITLEDNQDFGELMISDGYAYAYRSFDHPRMQEYTLAEQVARMKKHGLWAKEACRDSSQSVSQISLAWQQYVDSLIKLLSLISKML